MISLLRRKKKRGPYFSTSGVGWRLAYALESLADDLDAWLPEGAKWVDPHGVAHEVYGPSKRYVGTLGDARHKKEPSSDHNPFIRKGGKGIVRAMDVNFGHQPLNDFVRDQLSLRYWQGDPRLAARGYAKSNYYITRNKSHGGSLHNLTRHCDPGDPGHVHISLTRDGDLGYDIAIDSRAVWHFATKAVLPAPKPPAHVPTHAAPANALEDILSTSGAPATYKQVLADVTAASRAGTKAELTAMFGGDPMWSPDGKRHALVTLVRLARAYPVVDAVKTATGRVVLKSRRK